MWDCTPVCEVHACEVHACEVHACEVHACEVHACEVHACEVHAYGPRRPRGVTSALLPFRSIGVAIGASS